MAFSINKVCPPTLSQAHPVVKSWLRHCLKVKVKNKFHFLSARDGSPPLLLPLHTTLQHCKAETRLLIP